MTRLRHTLRVLIDGDSPLPWWLEVPRIAAVSALVGIALMCLVVTFQ